MGACLSCCGGDSSADGDIYRSQERGRVRTPAPDTPADRAARLAAADAAQARQQGFEQSAVGKAAIKSVKAVKEERAAAASKPAGPDSRDWLN